MNEISLALRRLSRLIVVVENEDGNQTKNECTILITNNMVGDSNNNNNRTHKPALGETWRAADARLILHPMHYILEDNRDVETNGKKVSTGLKMSKMTVVGATLEKHYAKGCLSNMVQFGIDNTGIVDNT